MNCEFVVERLESYVSHETDAAETARIADHLETCLACTEELRLVHACREAYRDLGNERIDTEFTDRVMNALPRPIGGTARILRFSTRVAALAAAIVLLVVLLDRDRSSRPAAVERVTDSRLVANGPSGDGPRSADAGSRVQPGTSVNEAGVLSGGVTESSSSALPVVRYVSAMEQDLAERMRATGDTLDSPDRDLIGGESLSARLDREDPTGRGDVRNPGDSGARPFPSSGFTVVVASLAGPGETWQDAAWRDEGWPAELH